jgi:hypothetical protein
MKISQLIELLEKSKEYMGDVRVYIFDNDTREHKPLYAYTNETNKKGVLLCVDADENYRSKHVCGLMGFGLPGDRCEACEQERSLWNTKKKTAKFGTLGK